MKNYAIASLFIGFVLLAWFVYQVNIAGYLDPAKHISLTDASKFGDFVGGAVGLLFTLAGVILLYETLKIQVIEFNKNREILTHQQFENSLFQRLNIQHEILNSMNYDEISSFSGALEHYNSRVFFNHVSTEIVRVYDILSSDFNSFHDGDIDFIKKLSTNPITLIYNEDIFLESNGNDKNLSFFRGYKSETKYDKAVSAYKIVFNRYHLLLGHYFRHLYHILKSIYRLKELEGSRNAMKKLNRIRGIVNERDLDSEVFKERFKNYADFVQAQMSSSELFVLFYNGLCFPKMKELIEEFDIVENLAIEDLIDPEHANFYNTRGRTFLEKAPAKFKSRRTI